MVSQAGVHVCVSITSDSISNGMVALTQFVGFNTALLSLQQQLFQLAPSTCAVTLASVSALPMLSGCECCLTSCSCIPRSDFISECQCALAGHGQ